MQISEKNQIKKYLLDYLKFVDPTFTFKGTKNLFRCPKCKQSNYTANFLNESKTKIHCMNPDCNITADIFEVTRIIKPTLIDAEDEKISKYLKHVLKITIKDETDKLLQLYKNSDFALIPLIGGHKDPKMNKVPIKEAKGWQKTSHKNPVIWKDWIDRGYNIGLNLGEVSNIVAVDIDCPKTFEKVKHMLGATLVQTTGRGSHYIYNYDPDFTKTLNKVLRDDGYEMELRTNNAYCVVAPSSVDGEIRKWNDGKIIDMPKELKDFFLKYLEKSGTNKEQSYEIIQDCIDNEKIDVVDLSGKRNDTFIKTMGVFRKWMNKDSVLKVMNFLSNNWIDKPIEKRELYAMMSQLDKYNLYDKEELAKIVLDRLDIIKEGSAFQIACTLKYEQKDIEDSLKYLEDQQKIIRLESGKYKKLKTVEWLSNFQELSIPVNFVVPYFHDYAYFDQSNMIIIGGKTGEGKTYLAANIIKKLIDQGVKPYLVNTEASSKIGKVAQRIGLREGDFLYTTVKHVNDIELPKDSVCIVDWIRPEEGNYARFDSTFEKLHEQMITKNCFLFVMVQIRSSNGEFFAKDLINHYAALSCTYNYTKSESSVIDNENTYFKTDKIRDSKTGMQYLTIPTKFNRDKCLLELK